MIKRILKGAAKQMGIEIHKTNQSFRQVSQATKFNWLREFNIGTVLDIGANAGQFAMAIRPFVPGATIYSFEPLKDVCEGVQRKASENRDAKWQAFNIALGDANGKQSIHRTKNTTDSSLLPMSERFASAYGGAQSESWTEEITVRRLDDFVAEGAIKIQPALMVKLDVQGFEDRVINGGENTIKQAKVVYCEVVFRKPLYDGQLLFDGLYQRLQRAWFQLRGVLSPRV
jgi:FkbM family methyltransferase